MKKLILLITTMLMAVAMSLTAYAGSWQKDETGYWWQNDDGSYLADGWQWLDGNGDGIAENYYFDGNGYCLTDTVTPDGFLVDGNGAWIVDGVVQQMFLNTDDSEYYITESEYDTDSYDSSSDGYSLSANTVVWLSRTGNKFHSDPGCSGMKNPIQSTYGEALSRGREACKKCY